MKTNARKLTGQQQQPLLDRAAKVTEFPSSQQLARVETNDYLGKVLFIERQLDEQRQTRERSGGVRSLKETKRICPERRAPRMVGFKAWVDEPSPGVPTEERARQGTGPLPNPSGRSSLASWSIPRRPRTINNRVENGHPHFAVGRRAWLFMDTQLGARASANLYSIVSTCRANGIELAHLTYLYERLPLAITVPDLEALLPWSVKPLLKAAAISNA